METVKVIPQIRDTLEVQVMQEIILETIKKFTRAGTSSRCENMSVPQILEQIVKIPAVVQQANGHGIPEVQVVERVLRST